MVGIVFEILDERLPRERPAGLPNSDPGSVVLWEKVDQKYCYPEQRHAFILKKLGDFIGWPKATYEYPYFDDTQQYNIDRSADYSKEVFLESKAYQDWKNRKIRGPGLLFVTGAGMFT